MSNSVDLKALLGDAGLGDNATRTLQLTADTLGPAIQAGLGHVSLDDITTAEVLLVTLLLDDSASIRFVSGNTEAVRDGHNQIVQSLRDSKQSASVLVSCRYLNASAGTQHGVLYPYRSLDEAELLNAHNYNPNGGTPLYDQLAVTLTGVAAKMTEFEQGGVAARAVTAVVSDGNDQHSMRYRSPGDIRQLVEPMLQSEKHGFLGMGIDDGTTDFHSVFTQMGFPTDCILTPQNSPSEIRRAFQAFSQSMVRASQAMANQTFSQAALGGFGA